MFIVWIVAFMVHSTVLLGVAWILSRALEGRTGSQRAAPPARRSAAAPSASRLGRPGTRTLTPRGAGRGAARPPAPGATRR